MALYAVWRYQGCGSKWRGYGKNLYHRCCLFCESGEWCRCDKHALDTWAAAHLWEATSLFRKTREGQRRPWCLSCVHRPDVIAYTSQAYPLQVISPHIRADCALRLGLVEQPF